MDRAVAIAVSITGDGSDASAAFDAVGSSAVDMARQVDTATANAASAAGRLDTVAGSADNLDSKAGAATGALGALSSGFELVGAEKYAGALQGAALATDFFSGVGQAAALATQALSLANIKATASAVGSRIATTAVSAATKTYTAVQWALNAALSANPIGLVIAAVALLVAGIILAYKNSETFREIVKAAMEAARTAVGWVVDKVGALADLVSGRAQTVWKGVQTAAEPVFDAVKKAVDLALTPIRTMIDLVESLIGWIAKIDFPDIPWPGGGGDSVVSPTPRGAVPAGGTVVYITVEGALDSYSVAQQIAALLAQYGITVQRVAA